MAFRKWGIYSILLDIALVLVAGCLLYYGSSWQFVKHDVDAAIYQCYAVAFWQGAVGLQHLPAAQCAFLHNQDLLNSVILSMQKYHVPHFITQFAAWQDSVSQFHTLPREYPIVTLLLSFTVPLLAPAQFYQQAFAIWAIFFIVLLYFLLKRYTSWWGAILFLAYLVVAGWSTAVSRFDIFPAGMTMAALLLASKGKWKWAYTCIVVATLLKFYPIVLVVPIFIAQQQQLSEKWNAWRRWQDLAIGFVGVFAGIVIVSLFVSIPGTLGALKYFTSRPLEIESLPASFVWLGSFVGFPFKWAYEFVSMNVWSGISGKISVLSTALLVIGLLYTFWLQYRGKLEMKMAALVILALMLSTSKIVSPQYMIWIIPLVAYVGKANWRWILPWSVVMVLTYYIYPIVYNYSSPPPEIIFPLAMARGLIMLGFAVIILYTQTSAPKVKPQSGLTVDPLERKEPVVVERSANSLS